MEIQEQEVVSLNEVCLACLIKTDNMKQLLYTDEEMLQLITKLTSVSNLEIEVNDTLPSFLCNSCEEKLHISYDFQQLCQKSHQIILACLSASNSVILKENDMFNPSDGLDKAEICSEHLENNSNTFINNDLKKDMCVSYEPSEMDMPVEETDNFVILKEISNVAPTDCFENMDNLNETFVKSHNIGIDNINNELLNEGNFAESAEVHKEIKCSQTMKLHEYSEEVDDITQLDENSSDKQEQLEQFETGSNRSITFIDNDSDENLDEGGIKRINGNRNEPLNEENFVRPSEVDKRTKSNQTMRLPQYTAEEVNKIIEQTRRRIFQHVNCINCEFMAKDSRALSLHMTRVHKELKERWCLRCNKHVENLNAHLEKYHKDDLKCPLCEKYRTSTGHFLEHLASHSTERKYVCDLCKKSFISTRHLKVHYKVHTNEKPYICKLCSEQFALLKSLNSHLRKIHDKHWCVTCEEFQESGVEYDIHKRLHHGGKEDGANSKNKVKPQNYCDTCKKKVRSLPTHIENHHSGKKKVADVAKALCTYCGKQFKSGSKLRVHVRTHTGETPYKCRYCDKKTTTSIHLKVHERTHTGERPYTCEYCGKKFTQSSVLNTHLKRHTGKQITCLECKKRFCRASELRQHKLTHTGEKPFECENCAKRFKQKSHLVEHLKIHSDLRPYKCKDCGKTFKQSSTLKSHCDIHLARQEAI